MDKNALKKYAIWARNELIARVSQKAQQYGITSEGYGDKNADSVNGVLLSATEKKQRQALIEKIDAEGFEQVMEEVAYTWFNRLTALRYMEVNGYLPSHTRVFTNEANEFKPQILADAISLDLEGLDMDKVFELKNANKDEDLYKYLLIVQCNALNSILPGMFQKIEDYTELLLPDNLLRENSIIMQMIISIDEKDWINSIEIIGWLYQFYISEPKDVLINAKKQYKKDDVPFVTQIFTSDWIVKYMVENSLGRYWIEDNAGELANFRWDYYLESGSSNVCGTNRNDPKNIKVIDPCMGSGHILVYIFDVLMQIYEDYGYSTRDAAESILANNIVGLDISERAYQLGYFSLMMKARQYSRSIFRTNIVPNVHCLNQGVSITDEIIKYVADGNSAVSNMLVSVKEQLKGVEVYGSLIKTSKLDYDLLIDAIKNKILEDTSSLVDIIYKEDCRKVLSLVSVAKILSEKYDFVITNPPYIGNKYLPKELKSYLDENYKDYKKDVFAAFVSRAIDMTKSNGQIGMLTPYVWMFISSYEELRTKILEETTISSLVQLEYNAFEAACVPVCSFTLKKQVNAGKGQYVRLSEFKGADVQGPKVIEAAADNSCGFRFAADQVRFDKVPGRPIAYWVDEKIIEGFVTGKCIDTFASPKQGMATTDNNKFLRYWTELDIKRILFGCESTEEAAESGYKWFPYNKGGEYRKWYGNNLYVVNYENDGQEIKNSVLEKYPYLNTPDFVVKNASSYFKKSITWSYISSTNFGVRASDTGFIFDVSGSSLFVDDSIYKYIIGFLCSKLSTEYINLINPTMNIQAGSVGSIPVIFDEDSKSRVEELVDECISISKMDWDLKETSWDFTIPSLFVNREMSIAESAEQAKLSFSNRISRLKACEEELNSIFIKLYSVQHAYTSKVDDYDITIEDFDLEREVKLLISYAVGCIMGRYSIDDPSYICTSEEIDKSKFTSFEPDSDGIVPICNDDYLEDDITTKFMQFIKVAYGTDNYEKNIEFIASVLGGKGNAKETIRNYFLSNFFADHTSLYKKRPIYWLFDSGKKNGFKCLVYIHRYKPDTIARIRTDYVHELQGRYRTEVNDLEQRISSASTNERVKLSKSLKLVSERSEELRKYEEKIHHLADQMIALDLDDGVKENYAKFQDVLAKIK